jgi:hypothetical protein
MFLLTTNIVVLVIIQIWFVKSWEGYHVRFFNRQTFYFL